MAYILYILAGAISGIFGGMGMGGGTLLIPILTLIFGVNQKVAQGVNLITFSIMAIFVLIFHIKNKLVNVKSAVQFFSYALIASVIGAIIANLIHASYLKQLFGILLIVISIFEATCEIRRASRKK